MPDKLSLIVRGMDLTYPCCLYQQPRVLTREDTDAVDMGLDHRRSVDCYRVCAPHCGKNRAVLQ